MRGTGLGDQELALLGWVAEHGPVSVGQAAAEYGAAHGLARSTVLTMMERLRAKKRLQRRRSAGVYVYAAREAQDQVLRGLVQSFVETKLAGSVSPFVYYLTEKSDVSESELSALEALVAELQSKRTRRRKGK